VALSQFVLPRPVALRAVTWCHHGCADPGAELDLPAVLRLARYGISRCPAGTLLGAQEPTRGSGVVSDCIRSDAVTWSAVFWRAIWQGSSRGPPGSTKRSRVDRIWGAIGAHASALGVPVSLRVLCETVAARLPVTGVAVAIRGGFVASEPLCVTDPLSRRLEELQLTLGEGPTLEVLAGAPAILVEDLDTPVYQARWPLFVPHAVDIGARAIFVLPLCLGAVRGGSSLSTSIARAGCRPQTSARRGCSLSWPWNCWSTSSTG